jgi:hypothetical protein
MFVIADQIIYLEILYLLSTWVAEWLGDFLPTNIPAPTGSISFIPKLKTIMVESITDPGISHSIGC